MDISVPPPDIDLPSVRPWCGPAITNYNFRNHLVETPPLSSPPARSTSLRYEAG